MPHTSPIMPYEPDDEKCPRQNTSFILAPCTSSEKWESQGTWRSLRLNDHEPKDTGLMLLAVGRSGHDIPQLGSISSAGRET